MRPKRTLRVTAIVANIKHFRRDFYERLAQRLGSRNIELRVIYSLPSGPESTKQDCVALSRPLGKLVPRFYFLGNRALLQMVPPREIFGADLIILVQANGYLLNYPLLLLAALRLKRVALWGHGWNRQGDPSSLGERIKRRLARLPTWWFAYTRKTELYLRGIGFDGRRVTCIDNAIDTRGFSLAVTATSTVDLGLMRDRLRLLSTDSVAIYCGSLYPEKRLPFLISAADDIYARLPSFRLIIVGSGPEVPLVTAAAATRSYLRYAGPLFGNDKAACFALSRLVLNPGLVGLGILDAFAAGLPVITTKAALHSPEIDYLETGVNGVVVDGDAKCYAERVLHLLAHPSDIATLAAGARAAAARYTIDNMVDNVERGIVACLGATAQRQA